MTDQFIRKCSLIVYGVGQTGGGAPSSSGANASAAAGSSVASLSPSQPPTPAGSQPGLDLSEFRIQFHVTAMDENTPPTATIRVLNLADTTVKQIKQEFQNVTLQAGYENGNFGVIFQGSIICIRSGRLSNIDTFVEIVAASLDAVYNFGVVSKTLKAGASYQDRLNAIQQGVADSPAAQGTPNALAAGVQYGSIPQNFGTGGVLPRGKVLFGLARDHWDDVTDSALCTWQVGPDGKVNFVPLTGYLPSEAVVITAQTGMIGVPEATQNGIELRCLLNPLIKCGTRIQLDNASIVTTANIQNAGQIEYGGIPPLFASTSDDGFYRVIVAEPEGDTRGEGDDWLTKIIALAVDPSAAPDSSVLPYG